MATEVVPVVKPPRRRRGLLLLLGFIVLLAGAAGYWWWQGSQDQTKYIALPVKRGNIVRAVNAAGMVEPVEKTGLDFKSSGLIKEIYVQPGDQVQAGQVLARLDTADLEAQVVQARANLEDAEAKLRTLQAGPLATDIAQAEESVIQAQIAYNSAVETLKRHQELFAAGALTRVELDNSIANRDTTAARLRQAQAALEALRNGNRPEDIAAAQARADAARAQLTLAENNLAGAELRAPWDGVISAVRGGIGQRAGSTSTGGNYDPANSFITLVTPKLQLSVQVNEADIDNVKIGQTATFTVNAFPGKNFKGQVTSTSPEATTVANVQLYDVVVSLAEPDLPLKAGMSASVNIINEQKEDVITVPRAAINFANSDQAASIINAGGQTPPRSDNAGGSPTPAGEEKGIKTPATGSKAGNGTPAQGADNNNKAVVLVLEQGQPVVRQIVTGLSDASNIEVRSGLEAGEQVIIGASIPGQPAVNSSSPAGGRPQGMMIR